MKYTFEDNQTTSFMCKSCLNVTELQFVTTVIGDTSSSNPPKIVNPDVKLAKVICGRCGNCMVGIDKGISYLIKRFNLDGYFTISSCGGHIERESYITPLTRLGVAIRDVKGLDQQIIHLEEPYVVFSDKMEPEKKVKLWSAILKSICDRDGNNINPYFFASCKKIRNYKFEFDEDCGPDDKDAKISIRLRELTKEEYGHGQNYRVRFYEKGILEFVNLLLSILNKLPIEEDT